MLEKNLRAVSDLNDAGEKLRFIEFFAGIGGFAACCDSHKIVAAIDIDQAAKRVYGLNFGHPYFNISLESVKSDWLASFHANAWWLSPPCQPFSRRGRQQDRRDSRSRGLENLLHMIPQLRPNWILLENVIGFAESEMFELSRTILKEAGYNWQTLEICPSQWGWPNRRPRFYLMATTAALPAWKEFPEFEFGWKALVDPTFAEELIVDRAFYDKFHASLDRMGGEREHEPTACFGSSYGVVSSGAGSYFEYQPNRYRRFSPREVLRLLGFSDSFRLDQTLLLKKQWKLAGNSLSLPVVRYLLSHLT